MSSPSSDIAFTPAVKTVQARRGSRGVYAKVEAQGVNRQYITTGNLAENPRAFLFLMHYAHQRRQALGHSARRGGPGACRHPDAGGLSCSA